METKKNIFEYWWEVLSKNYANFNGRARRMEFWSFTLVNFLIGVVLGFTNSIFIYFDIYYLTTILTTIYTLGVFIPGLAVGVRRFHDTGNPGWAPVTIGVVGLLFNLSSSIGRYIFSPSSFRGIDENLLIILIGGLGLIFVGLAIYVIVMYFVNGTYGPNKYGPDPKQPNLGNEIDEIGNE